ncbi:flagellar protein FliS [Nocardioides sp. BE266]|uniref:flagellar export chaperone FliS n=1 Tax=Nocardioides sp. BE266 TaxID=2817725 RepID=UPI00285AA5E1|nr:flagellar export chaperone FliS [Nocardioides sp. BE266]MDR7252845.1 flagellar protein FliS [Nocardioides sp. BE266]
MAYTSHFASPYGSTSPASTTPLAYLQSSVETASPSKLLVMLYERLVLDCRRAVAAQQAGDHAVAHHNLLHAQDIVVELQSSLRPGVWEGSEGLNSIYTHLMVQLVQANVKRDVSITEHCLDLVVGLADAWREAAAEAARPADTARSA